MLLTVFREREACHATQSLRKNAMFWSGGRSRSEGGDFTGVSAEKAVLDRGNHLGLVSLNNSGRLWALGIVSSCLVSGCLWVHLEQGNTGLMYQS